MNKHSWCFFYIEKYIETEVVSCIHCQCLGNIKKDKFNKLVNEEKGKIHRSSIYNGYWNFSTLFYLLFFFALVFDLFYKDRFQGNCYNKSRKTYAQDLQPR